MQQEGSAEQIAVTQLGLTGGSSQPDVKDAPAVQSVWEQVP